jgi:hypothetical protein
LERPQRFSSIFILRRTSRGSTKQYHNAQRTTHNAKGRKYPNFPALYGVKNEDSANNSRDIDAVLSRYNQVIDTNQALVGIITQSDFVSAIEKSLSR